MGIQVGGSEVRSLDYKMLYNLFHENYKKIPPQGRYFYTKLIESKKYHAENWRRDVTAFFISLKSAPFSPTIMILACSILIPSP